MMRQVIGVRAATDGLAVGVVEGNRVAGPIRRYPESGSGSDCFTQMPAESYGDLLRREIEEAGGGAEIAAIGVGFPGIIRAGAVEGSPNLGEGIGLNLPPLLSPALPLAALVVLHYAGALA